MFNLYTTVTVINTSKWLNFHKSRKRFGSTRLPPGERANIQLSGTSVLNMHKYIRQTHFHRHGYRLTTNGGGGDIGDENDAISRLERLED